MTSEIVTIALVWGWIFVTFWLPDRWTHAMNLALCLAVFALSGEWWMLLILFYVGYAFNRSMFKYYGV